LGEHKNCANMVPPFFEGEKLEFMLAWFFVLSHNVQIEASSRPLAKVVSNAGLGIAPGEEQDGNV
jgi:hypothetical protein